MQKTREPHGQVGVEAEEERDKNLRVLPLFKILAQEQHKSFFAPSEAADIKSVMQEYGETTEQQNMVGAWLCDYAESRQPFDEIKHRHTLKEVGDVAEGKYDWKIEQNHRMALNK